MIPGTAEDHRERRAHLVGSRRLVMNNDRSPFRSAVSAAVALAVLAASCAAGNESGREGSAEANSGSAASAESAAREPADIDEALSRYYREHHLPTGVLGEKDAAFENRVRAKSTRMKELEERLFGKVGGGSTEASKARYRVGVLHLNFGCELVRLEPPDGDSSRRSAYPEYVTAKITKHLRRARQMFQRIPDGGTWGDRSDSILQSWRPIGESRGIEGARAFCQATYGVWRNDDTAESERSSSDRERQSEGPPEGLNRAEIACEVDSGEACLEETVAVQESHRATDVERCREGGALGCLRLARLLRRESGPNFAEVCDEHGGPEIEDPEKRCLEKKDAAGCFARAATLLKENSVDLPATGTMVVGSSMGAARISRSKWEGLRESCQEGDVSACLEAAARAPAFDEQPEPLLREACNEESRRACHKLGLHLLDGEHASRGVDLLESNCTDGYAHSCRRAAEERIEGEGVARNEVCATAFAWRGCKPDRPSDCGTIQRLFEADDADGE